MRRLTGFILVLIIISAVSCKSGKKYSDIREFINEVVTTQDEFLSKIDKSINADDVVSAVDVFGVKLDKAFREKYGIKDKIS